MTGLLFTDTLPYRLGLCLELQIPLHGELVVLPAVVRRQVLWPAGPRGGAATFECGVSLRLPLMSAVTRRRLMEFLIVRAPDVYAGMPSARPAGPWPGLRPLSS